MNSKTFCTSLLAAFALATPALADHNRTTVYRDRDGDGHYNKKTYGHGDHHNHGYYNRGYNRGYYGGGYGYGYRPYYGYGGGYGYGYRPYYGPSIGLSFSTNRSYNRGYSANDSLAVDVQRALQRRGYYRGYIDGDIGPGSRSAIRAYQRDRGLSVTGRIDTSLLRSLGVS